MAGAGALLAATTLPVVSGRAAEPAPNDLTPKEVFDRLKAGNDRYVANAPAQRDFEAGRAARSAAQYPIAAVLACSDSRVPPEIVMDQGPGELFLVRVAGNVVSNYGLASMEFAVEVLGVPMLLVLGHSGCGAVAAALQSSRERSKLPGHLPELVEAIQPAVIAAHGKHPGDFLAATIEENVRLNMRRLTDDSKILAAAFAAEKIGVAGGVYDIATGKIKLV
ncbi:MAG TPA: carbonic anhydrase [Methyloceanibacter sp.]|nr:carbonic anhydrase [Methyloceanibacter sp.]